MPQPFQWNLCKGKYDGEKSKRKETVVLLQLKYLTGKKKRERERKAARQREAGRESISVCCITRR